MEEKEDERRGDRLAELYPSHMSKMRRELPIKKGVGRAEIKANSTSTLFVSSTMSVPNNDETILSVSTILFCQISQEATPEDASQKPFRRFNEDYYRKAGARHVESMQVTVEDIYKFIHAVFEIAQFSPECNVIMLVFINRLVAFTGIQIHSKNWRPLVLCSLLLAQKVWDDRCLANVDFPVIWRAVVPNADANLLTLKAINALERRFLELLQYNVTINSSLYAKYYFELRSLCEENHRNFPLAPLSVDQASRLDVTRVLSTKLSGAKKKEGEPKLEVKRHRRDSNIGISKTLEDLTVTTKARAIVS